MTLNEIIEAAREDCPEASLAKIMSADLFFPEECWSPHYDEFMPVESIRCSVGTYGKISIYLS